MTPALLLEAAPVTHDDLVIATSLILAILAGIFVAVLLIGDTIEKLLEKK